MSSFVTKKPRIMLINFQEIRAYPKIAECLSSAVILYSVYVKCSFISLSNYAKHLIKNDIGNSADPDQTPQHAAFDQGLHCLHIIDCTVYKI